MYCVIFCLFENCIELTSRELISWEVDLVGVDLVGVDVVGVDLVGMNHNNIHKTIAIKFSVHINAPLKLFCNFTLIEKSDWFL